MPRLLNRPIPEPIPLVAGTHKSYAKEPKFHWVFRLLEMEPLPVGAPAKWNLVGFTEDGVELRHARADFPKIVEVSECRRLALAAWIHFELAGAEDVLGEPVVAVLANPKCDEFLLQQKDDKHPVKAFRHRYCPFGGSYLRLLLESGRYRKENPITGMVRELYEEIRYPIIVDQLTFLMRCQETLPLWTPQFRMDYRCRWWVIVADTDLQFQGWKRLFFDDGLAEAMPAHLTARDLLRIEREEQSHPGSQFCNNQQELYLRVMRGDFAA